MANVLVTGGTGFIGSAVVQKLVETGHQVAVLTRSQARVSGHPSIRYVTWPKDMSQVEEQFGPIDFIINLAGDPINKGRWTVAKKQAIINSRVQMTAKVVDCINMLTNKPKLLINASAIGYYGFSEERTFTEQDVIAPHNFLTEVSAAWESEARKAEVAGVRVVLARFGIVLGKTGGALAPMVLPYQLFGGGTVASGKQWLSWIHLADVVGLMMHIIQNESIHGPVNFTAPQPMQMKPFGQAIGVALRRPHWLPVPAFALRLLFGEMGDLLIKGQKVLPAVALAHGYPFQFQDAQTALNDLLHRS